LVVLAQQAHNFPRQHAGSAHAQHGFALALEQRHNDRIAFEKNFCGSIFRQQLVDPIVEVKAEIGSGVHAFFHQRPRQLRRVAHIGLQNHMMKHAILGGLLVLGRQEFVEHAVQAGEFSHLLISHHD
jgi:hypothetical protein